MVKKTTLRRVYGRHYSLREAAERFGHRGVFRDRPNKPTYRFSLSSRTLDEKMDVLFLRPGHSDNAFVSVEQKTKFFVGKFSVTHNLNLEGAIGLAVVGKEKTQKKDGSCARNKTYLIYDLLIPAEKGEGSISISEAKKRYSGYEVLKA